MDMSNYLSDDANGFEKALYELKRVDHLIYVSLKYTRTVDVIKNIVERLISTYDYVWDELLDRAERSHKIFEIPISPAMKCAALKKLHADPRLHKEIDFYLLLRQLNKAEYTSHQEYRRHVTMKAKLMSGSDVEINIDVITEYYKRTKEYMEYMILNYRPEHK
jgi:hypothetical protein